MQSIEGSSPYFSLIVKYWGKSHSYMTRSAAKNLLHIPANRTDRYSKKSAKYNCILDWNKFKQDFYGVNQDELSHFKLKILMRDHILHKYWKIYETFVSSNSTYILCSVYFPLSFSFFFFLFPSFLLRFCIFSLRYLFFLSLYIILSNNLLLIIYIKSSIRL